MSLLKKNPPADCIFYHCFNTKWRNCFSCRNRIILVTGSPFNGTSICKRVVTKCVCWIGGNEQ